MIVVSVGNLTWCIRCVYELCLRLRTTPQLVDAQVHFVEHGVCARCRKAV